jgi:Flp pilus assembly pilin Flp
MKLLHRLKVQTQRAITMTEYLIVLAGVAIFCIGAVKLFGDTLKQWWDALMKLLGFSNVG